MHLVGDILCSHPAYKDVLIGYIYDDTRGLQQVLAEPGTSHSLGWTAGFRWDLLDAPETAKERNKKAESSSNSHGCTRSREGSRWASELVFSECGFDFAGWACAEALVHYLLPLWIGARDVDFSWDYIEMGLLSNVNLALHLSNSASVFLGMRNDLDPIAFAMVLASCALQVSLPTLGNYMSLSLNKSSSTVLMLRMAIAVPLLGMSWINFRVYDRKKNI